MPAAGSLHIIESSEASARLREAERWLAARADRGALIVSASRGAADEIARAVRTVPRGDGRTPPLQFLAACRAPRGAGPRRARHRPGHAHRFGGGRCSSHVRRPAGRRPQLLRRRCRHARIPARARAHAPGSGDGGRGTGRVGRSPARGPGSVAPSGRFRGTIRRGIRHRSRVALHRRLRGRRGAFPPSAPPARRPDGIGGRVRAGQASDRRRARDARHRPFRRSRDARQPRDAWCARRNTRAVWRV